MLLRHNFDVPMSPELVWQTLLDLERVATCFPGAVVSRNEDGSYRGTMKLKIGPVRMAYEGSANLVEVDDDARRAVISVSGRETKGQGTAQAQIASVVTETDGGSHVEVTTDMALSGPAAQFGRGIVSDAADTLVGQFAERLSATLSGDGAASPGGPSPAASAPSDEGELDRGAAMWLPVVRALRPVALVLLGVLLGALLASLRRRSAPPPAVAPPAE
jgi:carbon monoxide dehydrogenase subunit G